MISLRMVMEPKKTNQASGGGVVAAGLNDEYLI